MAIENVYYCEKCNKTMGGDQFYSSNNLEKYPNEGKLNQCKKCITMHVDNWNPDTYLWILQEIDVPYIPEEWNKLMVTYAKDKSKLTGLSIIGRYLSKMKLKQFKDYRWKDNEFLQELNNSKIEQTMKRQGYDAQQIAQAINKATFDIPTEELTEPVYQTIEENEEPQEDYFAQQSGSDNDFDDDLTEEDRLYLRLKWGKTYKPEEWIRLEQLYKEMMDSYDIQSAGHIDTLKLICKTSLKANQLIDIGDVEGFQKMSKVYDSLMKSGKFTAAQNKSESGEFIDSISELVELCEKEGFIPRYYTETPMDKVDETLADLKGYTRSLVIEEMNLGNLIENAVKEMARQESKEEDEDIEDDLDIEEIEALKDEDFESYNEFLDEEISADWIGGLNYGFTKFIRSQLAKKKSRFVGRACSSYYSRGTLLYLFLA